MAHKKTALASRKSSGLSRLAKGHRKGAMHKAATVLARAPRKLANKVVTKTKFVFSAAKAPLAHVAMDEGTRMGAHGAAYLLDVAIPWRAFQGWLRPSTLLTASMFGLAAVAGRSNGGKWRVLFRNLGQGGLHHLEARTLDILHKMFATAPSGVAGLAGTSSDF
jgi:hypothetical protein